MLNFAQWTSEQAHQALVDSTPERVASNSALRRVEETWPGLKHTTVSRYRPYRYVEGGATALTYAESNSRLATILLLVAAAGTLLCAWNRQPDWRGGHRNHSLNWISRQFWKPDNGAAAKKGRHLRGRALSSEWLGSYR